MNSRSTVVLVHKTDHRFPPFWNTKGRPGDLPVVAYESGITKIREEVLGSLFDLDFIKVHLHTSFGVCVGAR